MEIRPWLALLGILCLFPQHRGHGMMCTPRQRGAYHARDKCGSNLSEPPNPVTDYCPHCLNGGTVATVKKNLPASGWKEYDPISDISTLKRAGLCGDPRANNDHMISGKFMKYEKLPIVKKWKSGSIVDFQIEVDTNHNGYFEFFLCNLDDCGVPDISEKCFRKHCFRLERVKVRRCESPTKKTHTQCGPVDEKYPSRFYVPCRNTGHVGVHLVGGDGTMLYKLPEGLSCAHCVLQWYWATANSCAPRGFLDYFKRYDNPFGTTCQSDGGGKGAHRKGMAACGGQTVPEEFWSCADVSITAGNQRSKEAPNAKPTKRGEPFAKKPNKASSSPVKKELKHQNLQSKDNNKAASRRTNSSEQQGRKGSPKKRKETPRKNNLSRPGRKGCVGDNVVCNGKVPCCGAEHVCVYKRNGGAFVCEIWWKLWSEVKVSTDRAVIMEEEEASDARIDGVGDEEEYEGDEELNDYIAYDKEL